MQLLNLKLAINKNFTLGMTKLGVINICSIELRLAARGAQTAATRVVLNCSNSILSCQVFLFAMLIHHTHADKRPIVVGLFVLTLISWPAE